MLLGIDIGTSSVKAILYDPDTVEIVARAQREYPIYKPTPDQAEQNPDDWWDATIAAVRQVIERAGRRDVLAIGLCGQMHGTVMLDRERQPLHPAIIWMDQRSAQQCDELVDLIGAAHYVAITGTMPATGFMAATLLWLRDHHPDLLAQIDAVILPKDYVRWKLTDAVATEPSDAAGTGLFDIATKSWSAEIIRSAGLPREIFPLVLDSQALAGELTPEAAAALGLSSGVPVVVGCADQPAQALGNGMVMPGVASVTIGSGGQVLMPMIPKPNAGVTIPTDPRLHVFNHAVPGMWYILGATLSAGLSLRWLRHIMALDDMGKAAYELFSSEAAAVAPGAEGLLFLPYLSGERTPYMDSRARGGFIGLSFYHERGHLARAVMEGVAFTLRHALEISSTLGGEVDSVVAAGGGANSETWRQILADVIGVPLQKSRFDEQAGIGAALLAGVGVGVYGTFEDAIQAMTQYSSQPTIQPQPEYRALYDALYEEFKALYPRLRDDFHMLSGLRAG